MRPTFTILFLLGSMTVFCQFYPLEVGGSGGFSSGINFRAYLEEELSYESLVSFRYDGLQAHLVRQQHHELEMMETGALYLVYGYGAHVGFYYTDQYSVFTRDIYFGQRIFTPVVGLDGYAALEYRFLDTPLSIGISYKPYMEISLRQIFGVNLWDFGFTAKYRFSSKNVYY